MMKLIEMQIIVALLIVAPPLIYSFGWHTSVWTISDDNIKMNVHFNSPFVKIQTLIDNKPLYFTSGVVFRLWHDRGIIFTYDKKSNINGMIIEKIKLNKDISSLFGMYNSYGIFKISQEGIILQSENGLRVKMKMYICDKKEDRSECSESALMTIKTH
ncbi:hypothetical protein ACET60_05665 [Aeromonas veronii]